jgi:transglutaminase-like putative cysteine protease
MDASSPTLRPTFYLDHDNPVVADFARTAAGDADTPRERARRIFVAVRDQIRYDPYTSSFDRDTYRASYVLSAGASFCVPKAILLGAALRSVGIPARLGFADVTNHLATRRLLEAARTNVFAFHAYTEVEIDGRFVKATPAFNATLCAHFGVPPLEFDGRTDALLQPFDGSGRAFMEYLRDRGRYDDFPFDEMCRVWLEVYPHLADVRDTADGRFVFGRRDFAADAAAERAPRR